MKTVFLSLGSNLGNKQNNLSTAITAITKNVGNVCLLSAIYETGAWGFESKDNFLNRVIMVMTDMEPSELMNCCLAIEKKMGRERNHSGNYESRLIDIDILFYGESIIVEDKLKIPHPLIHERRFVLEPLVEIAPDLIHPLFEKSISQLLDECADTGICIKYS